MLMEFLNGLEPYSAFAQLRDLTWPFMLTYGPPENRHTAMSAEPEITIQTIQGSTVAEGGDLEKRVFADPFEAVTEIMKVYKNRERGPLPFSAGGVGYFSYDLKDLIEPGRFEKKTGLELPDALFGFYDPVFIYRHRDATGFLISSSEDTTKLEEFKSRILASRGSGRPGEFQPACHLSSNMTKGEYLEAVLKAQEYISAGDIYQINLSHRLNMHFHGDPLAYYMELASRHPAPYSYFLDYKGFQVICNSPERLLKVKERAIETSPIKGTRPRGLTPEDDAALMEELKKSVKENAEHVMIVDLERSDLGKVSEAGSVEVAAFAGIETFPALHHMVSTVKGTLKHGVSGTDALRAIFPGGSITGAPKVRAMELIDELEPDGRGIYTGGIGWIDFSGNMDISMAIRTAVFKDGQMYLHVGGGIVADSVPEDEYRETLLKAKDFLDAAGIEPGEAIDGKNKTHGVH
ncbi:MAG: aminodeoxychorismate synthase, component I [Deltaproteobacteria bacterium GWC2_56_8]|nr:MAG: aminodeoxychorismate synthase, component I [Deltaproteobacteria bacterium GWB2_55_19]OGP32835.1 MAG: aminodeoxychorismate synthase, component I [Deltaproteobacteria bacterium GWC2_56_8]HAO92907.1 aminodeoxychorismate synthase component I [Deltaproteobacteria bacterium]